MIDYNKDIRTALETILPTIHEMVLTSNSPTPCISYQERDNAAQETGNTIGYSRILYTVKVWDTSIADIQTYAKQIDNVLRPMGFTRVSSNELYDYNSTMIQKIMTYECRAIETF